MSQALLALGLLAGTVLSEDAAGLAAGSLTAQGRIHWLAAGGAVFLGIWLGDLLLFAIGRRLRALAGRWAWARRRLGDARLIAAAGWLDRNTIEALAITRVVPGTRLPTYTAAGLIGMSARRFALWTAVAGLLWTPLLMLLGAGGTAMLHRLLPGWPDWLIAAVAITGFLVLVLGAGQALRAEARSAWAGRWARWRNHEWWPTWLWYLPVVALGAGLAIRHRCLRAPLIVNPAVPDSGIIGESKSAVLARLRNAPVLPWLLLPAGTPEARLARLERWLGRTGLGWPVVLKPDAGERGLGVRVAASREAAIAWFAVHPERAQAQRWHPGPVEVGIFYARLPGRRGRILSITDKRFASVAGDGRRSLHDLIGADPRLRLQRRIFLDRLGPRAGEVPPAGMVVPLGQVGNHAQGCRFADGAALITPALEAAVDGWMAGSPGLNYGRFDVRAADYDAVRAGRDLWVIELNGITSEPTALYDPEISAWRAWGLLFRAWRAAWAIGAAERRRGTRPPSLLGAWRRLAAERRRNAAKDRRSD